MRAWVSHAAGLEHLRLDERPVPRPAAGEVLLRMRAASVALRDHKMAMGAYDDGGQRGPRVLGAEGTGEVLECGAGVRGWRPGQRVQPLFSALAATTSDGCFADCMVVPADSLVEVPGHLSDIEAATLPFAALTAWSALHEQVRIGQGDTVVVQGTGGIPLFALQFARRAGAQVIVTSKNDDRLSRARALGADHVLNYQALPEWSLAVMELTGGRGADLVIDPGGSVTMAQSVRALRPGGTVCVVGALGASPDIAVPLPWLLGRNLRVQGSHAGSLQAHRDMNRAIAESGLRPVIERVVPFAEAGEAIAAAPTSERFGKVCLHI
jgi:NADPH:quinone reductase-like Zn-dependent oxidoreductase